MIESEMSKTPQSRYEPPLVLSDIRRVVFSGDASHIEYTRIREALMEAIPDFADRFVEEVIEPRWVSANGAAWLARSLKNEPIRWDGDLPYMREGDGLSSHDEL